MAQKKRGAASQQSSGSAMEASPDFIALGAASSDDEAPEEVTFEASKAAALQSMKQALDTARR